MDDQKKVMVIDAPRRGLRGVISALTGGGTKKTEVTESGLVLPAGTQKAARPRRVITKASYKLVIRTVKALEDEGKTDPKNGVSLVMICDGCTQIIRVQRHEGRMVLGCQCSVRDVV